MARRILRTLAGPFRTAAGADVPLVAVFAAINALVAVNAVLHDPAIGYDAFGHLQYIAHLAEGHLVSLADSHEYFSPPLPYAVPALVKAVLGLSPVWAGKVAQLLNVACSLATTWMVLRLCMVIHPDSRWLRITALLLLGSLPVYYRSFAFVRGEPWVTLFLTAAVWQVALMLRGAGLTLRGGALLGLTLGLAFLSRQWAFLMVPGLLGVAGIFVLRHPREWRRAATVLGTAMLVSAVLGGWFYVSLRARYGSTTAWVRGGETRFRLANNPPSFYLGLGNGALFSRPVRGSFDNQLVPIFYADAWGDYWGYFLVQGRDTRSGERLHGGRVYTIQQHEAHPPWLETNRGTSLAYLGRANLLGLAPTLLVLAGLLMGCLASLRWAVGIGNRPADGPMAVMTFCVLSSLLGFFVFLVLYPEPPQGGTIKATYMLQVFPLLAVLGAVALGRLRERSVRLFSVAAAGLAVIAVHNVPLMVTRFVRL